MNSVLLPPRPCFVKLTFLPYFFLLKLLYPMSVLTSTHLSPYTACIWQWMSIGGIFSAVKNSITAHCFNLVSSQPCILTGTKLELWIAMGSRLCTVEERYRMTAWNWFYPVLITLIWGSQRLHLFWACPHVSLISRISFSFICPLGRWLVFLLGVLILS